MKKLFFENIGLKISAVLLAVFLWFFVTWRGQSEISLDVPVEFKNVPADIGIINNSSKTVNITIKGHERLMKNIKTSNIRVFVDVGKAKRGEGIYYINTDDIKLPHTMSVININPASLKVKFDESVSQSVKVKPLISGIPEKGFYVSSVVTEPKDVVIHGLRSEARKINELTTEAFDITGLNKTVKRELEIDIAGANVKPEINKVKVKVVISGKKR